MPTNLNKIRKVYVGTNNGTDGGGISVFTNAGAGSIKTEAIHTDAGYSNDDLGNAWSGTDADDISAIASYSDTTVLGNGAFFRAQRKDVSLKQLQLDTIGALEDIRLELVAGSLFGSTQDVLGLGQGADLAENYSSEDQLVPGEVVSMEANNAGKVIRTSKPYDGQMLGVVATQPGLVLGSQEAGGYPIALVGRVPVKVTTENGEILAGDRLTSASLAGYAMKATQAGRVLGQALDDFAQSVCPEGTAEDIKCGTVNIFVNLVDYNGQSIAEAMTDAQNGGLTFDDNIFEPFYGLSGADQTQLADASRVLSYLSGRQIKMDKENSSEIQTEKVSTIETYSKNIYALNINVTQLNANRITGLETLTVDGAAEFRGNALFKSLVTFIEKAVFDNDVAFKGRATFNNDTAGFAVMKAGSQEIEVKFDKPFETNPVVTMSVRNGLFVQYAYKDLSTEGFKIILPEPSEQDVEFAWTALSVKDARTIHQDEEGKLQQQFSEPPN
jgi:hypothetical protein